LRKNEAYNDNNHVIFFEVFLYIENNDVETVSLPTERKENEWFLENHVFRRIH